VSLKPGRSPSKFHDDPDIFHGLIVLGQWPDLDRVASVQGITVMLARLAESVDDPGDQKALRQTAGAIGRLGEAIFDAAAESVGGQLAS
jgi:hypothetical protein